MYNLIEVSEFRENCSVTETYYSGSIKFIRPIGIRYTALEKILLPFSTDVWISLIIAILTVFAIDYWFFGQSMFEGVRILLGGEILRLSFTNCCRLILGTWIIALVIVRSAYQGALFDILQSQIRYQPIRTIADVIRFNRTIYCSETICQLLQSDNVYSKLR